VEKSYCRFAYVASPSKAVRSAQSRARAARQRFARDSALSSLTARSAARTIARG
jgi:hypothetical protein